MSYAYSGLLQYAAALDAGAGDIAGSSAGTSTATATLTAQGDLAGSSAGTSTATGALTGDGALAATADGSSTATGVLTAAGALAGSTAGSSTTAGALEGAGALAGATAGTGSASAELTGAGALVGSSAGTSTASGTADQPTGSIAGTSDGSSTATGTLTATGALAAAAAGTSTATGALEGLGALSGSSAGTSTATLTVSGSGGPSLDGVTSLQYWWEVDTDHATLDESLNVEQLDERIADAHAFHPAPENRPAYTSSGGPNGLDCITMQDAARYLFAEISVAAANRYGVYIVSTVPASGGRIPSTLATEAGPTPIERVGSRNALTANFEGYCAFTGGAQTAEVTSPPHDTEWHLHSLRPLASGAVYEIDGEPVTADFTGSDTVAAYDRFVIGHWALSGGAFWACFITDEAGDVTTQQIENYVEFHAGISLPDSGLVFGAAAGSSTATATLTGNVSLLPSTRRISEAVPDRLIRERVIVRKIRERAGT